MPRLRHAEHLERALFAYPRRCRDIPFTVVTPTSAVLRTANATLALHAGIHPKVVSERLGHATMPITLDTYSHAIPAMQEEAAALIAGLVFAQG